MPSKALRNNITAQSAPTPQRKQADPRQVKNNAGGYTFEVSDKSRLERFLILGTDGGTYYVNERKLTDQNVKFITDLIKRDPQLVFDTTVEISHSGRAYRNSQALFVMALLFKHAGPDLKESLVSSLPRVARTSTHLFEFAEYIDGLKAWGRSKRRAVANWYGSKNNDQVAYQVVKYRQRNGWTHKDMLALSHVKGVDPQIGNFVLGKEHGPVPAIIEGFKSAQQQSNIKGLVNVLDVYKNLPWEAVPTEFHNKPELWKKLLENGELKGQALLRQITRLAKLGMFNDLAFARQYADLLMDQEMIVKSRLHPIQYLLALTVHQEGQRERNSYGRQRPWTPSSIIRDALNEGYYKAFAAVEPANKRTFVGVDVSGSMTSMAVGIDLTHAQVAGAMAMTIARTEPFYEVRGFTTKPGGGWRSDSELTDLGISKSTELNDAMRKVQKSNFGGTDCSLPMQYALARKMPIDTFVVITDNETWHGSIHPHEALRQYRNAMNIPDAKLVVMATAATPFTIADPTDRGMLDVVGADTNVPRIVADFSAGRL